MKSQKLVLIIEEDKILNESLRCVFDDANYHVLQSFNSKSAIHSVSKQSPDLIILDISLTDIDAYHFCKQLKMNCRTNPIPIIMLMDQDNERNHYGLKIDADCRIQKPFVNGELLNESNRLLMRKNEINNNSSIEMIHFILNSDIQLIDQLIDLISIPLSRTSFNDKEKDDIKLGLSEIVTNAIEWGNQFQQNLLVKVSYEVIKEWLTICVEDQGNNFNFNYFLRSDYKSIEYQDERLNTDKRLGGFGIKIAQNCFDLLYTNDLEKKIILKKRF